MTSSEPIPPAVLKRKAVVYVRQSSQSQVLTRISQGSEGRVHFCGFVSRIKHLRHMRRACPSEAQNRLSSFDCRSNGCSTLISDSNVEYRHAIPVEV